MKKKAIPKKNFTLKKKKRLRENHTIHTWYDRDTAKAVKDEMIRQNLSELYRACQFTYMLCVRSQSELMKLKVGDIDRKLKRVRFRKEVSKNGREAYRSYPPEFEKVLDDMKFNIIPKTHYLVGKYGQPHESRCEEYFG